MHAPSRHAAFSLMELLLAIAIVAVLVTLSVSIGQSVRRRSNDTRCIANLRQSGQAILNYLNDHNGRFLPKKYWFQYSSYRASSNRGMREYFGVEADSTPGAESQWIDTILTCPSMLQRWPQFKDTMFRRGYGINYYLFQTVDEKEVTSFKNLRAIPNLSAMWALTDAAIGGGNTNTEAKEPLGSVNDNTAYHQTNFLPYPHAGGLNHFVFLDGHVEGLTREELRNRPSLREFWGNTALPE